MKRALRRLPTRTPFRGLRGACRWAAIFAVTTGGGGCAVLHKDFGNPLPPVPPLEDGAGTYRDVLQAMGPPHKLTRLGDGFAFLYEHAALTERQFGFSVDYPVLRVFKAVVGKGVADREVAVFVFDPAGRLRARQAHAWTEQLGRGSSLQAVVAVVSVVNTGEIDTPPDAHTWGGTLLEPNLSIALNRENTLRSGQQGLEQRGTPARTGQHALEFSEWNRANGNN